jgi:DNA modification methylase
MTVPPESVDLVCTDPPFNIGLDYPGYFDRRQIDDYQDFLHSVFRDLKYLLKPTGSLFVALDPRYVGGAMDDLRAMGFHWRNTIIWHYTFGQNQKKKFTPSYTPILYFTRHAKDFTFNADAVRIPSARQTVYGDKRANPKGKVPDDVWNFPRVAGTFKERAKHVTQQPLALVERMVRVASNPGDLVLDPFCGTGTTLVAARRLGRRALGIELCPSTADIAQKRLSECEEAIHAGGGL